MMPDDLARAIGDNAVKALGGAAVSACSLLRVALVDRHLMRS